MLQFPHRHAATWLAHPQALAANVIDARRTAWLQCSTARYDCKHRSVVLRQRIGYKASRRCIDERGALHPEIKPCAAQVVCSGGVQSNACRAARVE